MRITAHLGSTATSLTPDCVHARTLMKSTVAAAVFMQAGALPAGGQDVTALAIEGWRSDVGRDGVVYYRCSSDICAAGSVVSYKTQPHHDVTLAQFEEHHRKLALSNTGVGAIRDASVDGFEERQVENVTILQCNRDVTWTDGTKTYTIDARLIGPSKSFSLVSDSAKHEWTVANFRGISPLSCRDCRHRGRAVTRGSLRARPSLSRTSW